MKDSKISGAKSIVMQPLFAAKVQKDRKKEGQLIRKQKHKNHADW